ncbi:MAG TPA: hypothetical protein DCL38_03465 [Lachnospiraceae bacterium]|nr:hypothetical protein [Lachnospiraceae bacterium]
MGFKAGKTAFVMAFTIFAGWFLIPASAVFAAGSINLTADRTEGIAVGDSIAVTCEAVSEGDAAAEISGVTVEYDPNRLELIEADKEYTAGEGNALFSQLPAVMSFTVISGGEAMITASAPPAAEGEESISSSITIKAEGEDTAALMSSSEGDYSTMGVAAQTIASPDGSVLVSTVFPEEYMPAFFHKSTTLYQGVETECAKFESGEVELLYTTDQSGQNGAFKAFDESTGELSDFRIIEGPEGKYIIIQKAPDTAAPPAGYTKATLQWNGQSFEAYMNMENPDASQNTDFFLVYAISSEGNTGWYMYDQTEGTYQRFVSDKAAVPEETEEEGFLGLPVRALVIIGVLGFLTILFLIIMIIALVKLKDYESYEYIDEDEDEPRTGEPLSNTARAGGSSGNALTAASGDALTESGKAGRDKKKDKADRKEKKSKRGEEAGSLDFAAMESAMKGTDDRRPKGTLNNAYLKEEAQKGAALEERAPVAAAGQLKKPVTGEGAGRLAGAVIRPSAENAPKVSDMPLKSAAPKKAADAAGPAPKKETADASPKGSRLKQKTEEKGAALQNLKPKAQGAGLTEQQKEDKKREELLNAARQPELKSQEAAYPDNGQYYQEGYQGQYYNTDAQYDQYQYAPDAWQGQYDQNGYAQEGYGGYQYGGEQGYDPAGQYGGYYEPVPSVSQYDREQFGNAQYNMQYAQGYGQYGNNGYEQNAYGQGQVPGGYDSTDMDDDDDFEFEFINMGE